MIGEVISIGDELTSGQRLDTNSQWLSQQLGELGVRVLYHTTVADDLAANVEVFRLALARADLVVATGGLGPTADDLTRDALAAATGTELVLDEASLAHIRELFARYHREMPDRNRSQAMFPTGSRPIFNPNGTAPGVWIEVARDGRPACRLFALPGVPVEMREMFAATVSPAIAAALGTRRVIRHRRIKCFGAGESQIEQMLPDLIRRGREPSVGITVHDATITLRVTASGATDEECEALMQPTIATIEDCLGNLVFGYEDEELEHVVMRMLAERGKTLATIEGGSHGLLAQWLHENASGSVAFAGGLVIPEPKSWSAEAAKSGEIAKPSAMAKSSAIADEGSSPESQAVGTAATACRQYFDTDFALAVGTFPIWIDPPTTSPANIPEYHYALARRDQVTVKTAPLAGHPEIRSPRAAKLALNLLRLELLHHT